MILPDGTLVLCLIHIAHESLKRHTLVPDMNLLATEKPIQMAELTLQKMAAGGIYDHLGGGFARWGSLLNHLLQICDWDLESFPRVA